MKKTFFKSALAIFAGAFILTGGGLGCKQEPTYEVIVDSDILRLEKVKNFKAKAYPGATLLTWDAVNDCAGYDIYRNDEDGGSKYLGNVSNTDVSYWDYISIDNDWTDGQRFTYRIQAVSKSALNNMRIVVSDTDVIGSSDFAEVSVNAINDGFKTTVVFNVPSNGSFKDFNYATKTELGERNLVNPNVEIIEDGKSRWIKFDKAPYLTYSVEVLLPSTSGKNTTYMFSNLNIKNSIAELKNIPAFDYGWTTVKLVAEDANGYYKSADVSETSVNVEVDGTAFWNPELKIVWNESGKNWKVAWNAYTKDGNPAKDTSDYTLYYYNSSSSIFRTVYNSEITYDEKAGQFYAHVDTFYASDYDSIAVFAKNDGKNVQTGGKDFASAKVEATADSGITWDADIKTEWNESYRQWIITWKSYNYSGNHGDTPASEESVYTLYYFSDNNGNGNAAGSNYKEISNYSWYNNGYNKYTDTWSVLVAPEEGYDSIAIEAKVGGKTIDTKTAKLSTTNVPVSSWYANLTATSSDVQDNAVIEDLVKVNNTTVAEDTTKLRLYFEPLYGLDDVTYEISSKHGSNGEEYVCTTNLTTVRLYNEYGGSSNYMVTDDIDYWNEEITYTLYAYYKGERLESKKQSVTVYPSYKNGVNNVTIASCTKDYISYNAGVYDVVDGISNQDALYGDGDGNGNKPTFTIYTSDTPNGTGTPVLTMTDYNGGYCYFYGESYNFRNFIWLEVSYKGRTETSNLVANWNANPTATSSIVNNNSTIEELVKGNGTTFDFNTTNISLYFKPIIANGEVLDEVTYEVYRKSVYESDEVFFTSLHNKVKLYEYGSPEDYLVTVGLPYSDEETTYTVYACYNGERLKTLEDENQSATVYPSSNVNVGSVYVNSFDNFSVSYSANVYDVVDGISNQDALYGDNNGNRPAFTIWTAETVDDMRTSVATTDYNGGYYYFNDDETALLQNFVWIEVTYKGKSSISAPVEKN